MDKQGDITLYWLPSEIPTATAEQMWKSSLGDAVSLWIRAADIARELNKKPPRSPSSDEMAIEYLKYLESEGYSIEEIKANFFASYDRMSADIATQKKKADDFMRYVEDNAFHIDKDIFNKYVDNISIEYIIDYAITHSRRLKAKRAAANRLKADPKQADKATVREFWELWRDEKSRYKSKAAFAKDMLDKFEQLESQRVIERWCKEWESEPS